jgi:hypothetical protein
MNKLTLLLGQRFGRLVVLGPADKRYFYKVLCDCGVTKDVLVYKLRAATTKSCGCLQRELKVIRMTGKKYALKHGHSRRRCHGGFSPTYRSFRSMLVRVLNPNSDRYPYYGGRGISVCDRWNLAKGGSFENFLVDMGERPQGMSIDRIDVNGNYELRNAKGELQCRWATQKEQIANRRCSAKNKITEQIAA